MNNIQVADKEFEIFLEHENINKRTRLLGIQINVDYENRCPVFIGVLNGSILFIADLLKELNISCEVEFIKLSSYEGGLASTGKVSEIFGLPSNLHNRDVIIVEDIVDTDAPLNTLFKSLRSKNQHPLRYAHCCLNRVHCLNP